MNALCSVVLLAGISFSLPSLGQDGCALAVQAPTASQRAENSLRRLRGMFNGNSINAGIAVDQILNEVQMKLADSDVEKLRDSFASDNFSRSAQDQTALLQKSIKDLEDSLEQKQKGLFQRLRKNFLSTQIKERMEQLESGKKQTAQLIESVRKNIETLRQQQLDVETWKVKVAVEIEFLQEVANRVTEDSLNGNGSENFVNNANNEIVPRLLYQANNLMSQQVVLVKSIESGLKTKVVIEQTTLENLQTLQNLSLEVAVMKARKFLGLELVEAELSEEQQRANDLACQSRDFCAGEVIGYIGEHRATSISLPEDVVNGAITNPGRSLDSQIAFADKKGERTLVKTYLARRQPGLSWKGFAIGSHVKSKMADTYWEVYGIYSDGDLLLKEVYKREDKKTRKPFYRPVSSSVNYVSYFSFIRMPSELVEKAPRGLP